MSKIFLHKFTKMKVTEIDDESTTLEELEDCDTCDETTIKQVFSQKCEGITSKLIDKDKYILHMDGTSSSTPNIILGLSDDTVEIYNFSNNQVAKLHTFKTSDNVIGVKASDQDENLFYVGSKDCQIKIVDLRDPTSMTCFKDSTLESDSDYKPLNCFDVSSNNLLLSGGTDLHAGDAYVLFWDIRSLELLGAYWECHTDDVTDVKFHPTDPNKLISGSTDGLINLYDLSHPSEDDALVDSLNSESSVERICWFNEGNFDMIGCTTHTSDLEVWKLDDAQPYVHYRKEDIAKEMMRKLEDYCYVATMQVNKNGQLMSLVGSNYGDGECLRAFGIDKSLVPLFDVKGNRQRVRCSWLNKNGDILVTAGEAGILDIWNVETNFATNNKRKKV